VNYLGSSFEDRRISIFIES